MFYGSSAMVSTSDDLCQMQQLLSPYDLSIIVETFPDARHLPRIWSEEWVGCHRHWAKSGSRQYTAEDPI